MIAISSYLHRDELNDLIRRWMYNDPRPSDIKLIFRLIQFNIVYTSRYLQFFAEQLFRMLHGHSLCSKHVFRKGDLKDLIVANPPYRSLRIEEMVDAYREFPELYYRETPFYGILFFKHDHVTDEYIGSCRLKRMNRLAEKVARRIVDQIFETIKKRANALADQRALKQGLTHQQLVTSPEDMTAEFLKAESRLIDDFRHRRPIREVRELFINDVAGVKVIVEDSQQQHFSNRLGLMEHLEIIEEEVHSGRYNATSLIVRFCPPRERLLHVLPGEKILKVWQAKGWDPEQANGEFCEFVRSGEEDVYLEIIVSSYQEMLESEIGRCMHEDRIIEQRHRQRYSSQLSRNIEYLMEYLFALPASARVELGDLPIKLWNRYLPDYFDEILKQLFQIPSIEVLD
jgi:hypothetical protein